MYIQRKEGGHELVTAGKEVGRSDGYCCRHCGRCLDWRLALGSRRPGLGTDCGLWLGAGRFLKSVGHDGKSVGPTPNLKKI